MSVQFCRGFAVVVASFPPPYWRSGGEVGLMLDDGQPFSPPAAAVTFRGDSPCVAGRRWMIVCAQAGLLLRCWSVDGGPINIYIELREFKHGSGSGFECTVGINVH